MPDIAKLKIVNGPRAGERVTLTVGAPVIVGRSATATIRIDTPGLSRQHFELEWDGHACLLRDLNSRNGVMVNGERVTEAVLRPGDVIDAAETRYTLEISAAKRRLVEADEETASYARVSSDGPSEQVLEAEPDTLHVPLAVFEHVTPTMTTADPPALAENPLLAALVRVCASGDGHVYALVDGAQAFELAFAARLMGSHLYTLFSGARAADLAHVGPCLLDLQQREAFLEKWVAACGTNAGVLVQTRVDLPDLYAHLRKIFTVTDEHGQEYFFRYYDPRVLRAFLPTCTDAELREFFGPVQRWIAETPGHGFESFSLAGSQLARSSITDRETANR